MLFFTHEKDRKRKFVKPQRHGEQSAVIDGNIVNMFYNEQVAYIERWIEHFTSQEGTGAAIDHCIKLYLKTAKYEPLKGSSYIPFPKPIASQKAIINVKNGDDKCLGLALESALYPTKTNANKQIQRIYVPRHYCTLKND